MDDRPQDDKHFIALGLHLSCTCVRACPAISCSFVCSGMLP